jgi:hypothetical protein
MSAIGGCGDDSRPTPKNASQEYLERSAPYDAAIEAAGDVPWHGGNIEARRELFMRRWQKLAAPTT